MELDRSWESLLRPGNASNHFDLRTVPRFEAETAEYSAPNAWWLAEISRLVYRDASAEPSRAAILARADLEEVRGVERAGLHGAVIRSVRPGDTRFTVLAFRGSNELRNWLTNLKTIPRTWEHGGVVHAGFRSALRTLWGDLEPVLRDACEPLFCTGHSLGAALATLAAALRPPRAVYTFGSPRVGDQSFVERLAATRIHRVVHHADLVPSLPPTIGPLRFRPAGELRYIAHDGTLWYAPPDDIVATDRRARGRLGDEIDPRRWTQPPEFLSDHAPANYSARLERLVPA